jgi:hypothetical protein
MRSALSNAARALAVQVRKARRGLWFGVAIFTVVAPILFLSLNGSTVRESDSTGSASAVIATSSHLFANALHPPSADVQRIVNWIAASKDNAAQFFVVVDKRNAVAHVFSADARWVSSSPILVGSAIGDDSVPGIGTRPIALVKPDERTTPAGRFVAEVGRNAQGDTVVWVDYDAAVSMHSVRLNNASEQRLQRLASPYAEDRRISYGCINFPDAFFKAQILPRFAAGKGLVYVLPDLKSVDLVFDTSSPVRGDTRARAVVF